MSTATPNGACKLSTCNAGFHVDSANNVCAPNTNTSCGSPPVNCTAIANATATCTTSSGTCSVTCNTGYHLYNGGCEANSDTVCGAGYHNCNGSCVSNTSVNNCGASCSPCPTDPNGTAVCNGTSCGITCATGYNHCAAGACVADSSTVCGSNCENCPAVNGVGWGCSGGMCVCVNPMQCKL